MALLITLIIFIISCLSIFYPWIGSCAGYFITILGPQYIWFWAFKSIRPFYYIAIPTIVGYLFCFVNGRIDTRPYFFKFNICLLVYFLFLFLSYFFGPWVHKENSFTLWHPYYIFQNFIKVFIFYYISIVLINNKFKLKIFSLILIVSGFYLIYWANMMYFSGKYFSRLSGPVSPNGVGIYGDENQFAMFFVVTIPFLFYYGLVSKRIITRIIYWSFIPFAWHAIFLTASRGGLLGTIFTLIFIALRLKKKFIFTFIIPLFLLFYYYQAGSVMKSRFSTISKYEQDASASGRIEIWHNTIKMFKKYPIFGVGLGAYHYAYPILFNYNKPRVAHNTFLQILGESGIFAFLSYIFCILLAILSLIRDSSLWKDIDPALWSINEATLTSLLGFTFCSLFLTLNGFELFFYLLVIVSSLRAFCHKYNI